jgi:hypothetical protein
VVTYEEPAEHALPEWKEVPAEPAQPAAIMTNNVPLAGRWEVVAMGFDLIAHILHFIILRYLTKTLCIFLNE